MTSSAISAELSEADGARSHEIGAADANPEAPEVGTAERELREHGVYMTNTIGHSMEPFLSHHRDAVVIAAPQRPPKRYDVVLYPGKGGSYILHRIIKVKRDHYVIRGDNNYFREYVPKAKIIGVLVSFTRAGKRGQVTDLGYRLYSRRRVLCYPLRVFYRRARAALAKLYRAVFRRKKR
jgi:signal peptidase I